MEELLKWADEKAGRHFIVKMGNTYNDTRWRVVVWAKEEGASIEGGPGEGYGALAKEAAKAAITAWEKQTVLPRRTGVSWYVPGALAEMLEDEP